MFDTSQAHPEDIFIDRYMPGATDAQRVEAKQNIRDLVAVLVQIDTRLARERADSHENEECGRVELASV